MRHKEEGVWIAPDLELCFYAQYWLQSSGIVAQLLERTAPVFYPLPSWTRSHIPHYQRYIWVDEFPFVQVGYVISLRGKMMGVVKCNTLKRLLEYPFVINSKNPKCYCFNMAIDGFGLSRKSPSFKRFLFLAKHSHQSPVLIWRIFTIKMKQHCVKWRTTRLTVGSDSTVDG